MCLFLSPSLPPAPLPSLVLLKGFHVERECFLAVVAALEVRLEVRLWVSIKHLETMLKVTEACYSVNNVPAMLEN